MARNGGPYGKSRSPPGSCCSQGLIATIAHRFQTDKIGAPYIEHPRRVAARLDDPKQIAAAWLHDVIEDCGITADDLVKAGISQKVVDAVVLLTRTQENTGDQYYEAIRSNPIALAVKLADIEDNTDPERAARLDPKKRAELAEKYENARRLLGVYGEQPFPSEARAK